MSLHSLCSLCALCVCGGEYLFPYTQLKFALIESLYTACAEFPGFRVTSLFLLCYTL
jgi:hypothetical protein